MAGVQLHLELRRFQQPARTRRPIERVLLCSIVGPDRRSDRCTTSVLGLHQLASPSHVGTARIAASEPSGSPRTSLRRFSAILTVLAAVRSIAHDFTTVGRQAAASERAVSDGPRSSNPAASLVVICWIIYEISTSRSHLRLPAMDGGG